LLDFEESLQDDDFFKQVKILNNKK